jgi:nitroreductase
MLGGRTMSIYDLIRARRTIRQFKPSPVPKDLLERLVDAARLAPSASNLQPLEYVVVHDKEMVQRIYPCLKWAAYIAPDGNPSPGREPAAYVVTLVNTAVKAKAFEWDAGAAIEHMILTALEEGVGSCWLLSVDKAKIREILHIPGSHEVDSVLALGYPAEEPVAEDLVDSVRYWKDESGRLHVPKRKVDSIIHFNTF